MKRYNVYPEAAPWHCIGYVDAETGKDAIKEAKRVYPEAGAAIVFNAEDWEEECNRSITI